MVIKCIILSLLMLMQCYFWINCMHYLLWRSLASGGVIYVCSFETWSARTDSVTPHVCLSSWDLGAPWACPNSPRWSSWRAPRFCSYWARAWTFCRAWTTSRYRFWTHFGSNWACGQTCVAILATLCSYLDSE